MAASIPPLLKKKDADCAVIGVQSGCRFLKTEIFQKRIRISGFRKPARLGRCCLVR